MPQSIPEIRGPIMSERAVPKAIVPRIEKHPKAKRARVRAPAPRAPTASSAPVTSRLARPRANAVNRSFVTSRWYPLYRQSPFSQRDDLLVQPGLVHDVRVFATIRRARWQGGD
jgi:hypothetical protein